MPLYPPNNLYSDCWSSVGNITFFHRDGKCFWKSKAYTEFSGTAAQLRTLDIHRRALLAWKGISEEDKKFWNQYATSVPSHRPPFGQDNHISGYNLFVSAYHGFARLGCEKTPAPQPFTQFPPFGVEVVSSSVEDGTMRIVCRVVMPGEPSPERFRLLGKIQLVEPGRSYNAGKMRTYLAEDVNTDEGGERLVCFSIPGYVEAFGLQLQKYTVHFRLMLIDEVTGYRNQYQKLSSLVSPM